MSLKMPEWHVRTLASQSDGRLKINSIFSKFWKFICTQLNYDFCVLGNVELVCGGVWRGVTEQSADRVLLLTTRYNLRRYVGQENISVISDYLHGFLRRGGPGIAPSSCAWCAGLAPGRARARLRRGEGRSQFCLSLESSRFSWDLQPPSAGQRWCLLLPGGHKKLSSKKCWADTCT